MSQMSNMALVDAGDFRTLFVDQLGWGNPDLSDTLISVDNQEFALRQVAGFKGLRVWVCDEVPSRGIQRLIDEAIGQTSHERLVIFAGPDRQEWRWPRRAQLGGTNAKLLTHLHKIGGPDPKMAARLQTIEIDFDQDISLVELLSRMRDAFDIEAEAASVEAARLMGTLYTLLDDAEVDEHDATLLLARLLFLYFADDSGMWTAGQFQQFLISHTSPDGISDDLRSLFHVLNQPEGRRDANVPDFLEAFRYVNGGLFADGLSIGTLPTQFRDALISASRFDWAIISPAVFGSMFQTVKDKESRRRGGEHYTTEANILKTVGPLFLDDLRQRFEDARDNRAALTRLHNDLGRLRIMDPACGCGNFLIVAYRELRALELDILKRQRELDVNEGRATIAGRGQLSFDVTGDIKVTLDHFYGIELEEWPARIAQTAMLLVDHLANQRMALDFGEAPDRLPIRISPTIVNGNALTQDWREILAPSADVIILGNPPFLGHDSREAAQASELRALWGEEIGRIDYVVGWYAKTLDYFGSDIDGRWAFVSTNSVTQGQPVSLVFGRVFAEGWQIAFAHRTFGWTSEARNAAAVHCVIVGFSRRRTFQPRLYEYETSRSSAVLQTAKSINAYLVDGPNVLVTARSTPLSSAIPRVGYGSRANDGGALIVDAAEYPAFAADPIARRYLRRFVGARELLHDEDRWVLWLKDAPASDVEESDLLRERVDAVRHHRLASKRLATRDWAARPTRFDFDSQPDVPYLCIPSVSSEQRNYLATQRFEPTVIASNLVFTAPDPDGFLFALVSSSMFMAWQKAIGGRLKSDIRFSNTLVWNNFPVPGLSAVDRSEVVSAGSTVMSARSSISGMTLAKQYAPGRMEPSLQAAHDDLDNVVDGIFGLSSGTTTETDRQSVLFTSYSELLKQGQLAIGADGRRRR
jgi:hypothetical protein